MPYCTECGSQVKETDKFCTNCGNRLKTSKQEIQQTQTIIEDNFWSSQIFEQYKQIIAWIIDAHSQAILDLTNEIIPYLRSHVVETDDAIRLGEGGPASINGLLFYLRWMSVIGQNTLHNFGIIPDKVTIPDENLMKISEKFQTFVDTYAATKDTSLMILKAASPFSDYANDLSALLFKEEVNNVKKTRNFEKCLKKFRENLEKSNLTKYNMKDYQRYLEANESGDLVTPALNAESSYGKFLYIYSYIIHDNFRTDVERYISPFFSANNVDTQFYETLSLVNECKNNSGFLKAPPPKLKEDTLSSLTTLSQMIMILASPYHVASSSYYDSDRILDRSKDIQKHIQRKKYREMLEEIYGLIYNANMVQPVFRLISPY